MSFLGHLATLTNKLTVNTDTINNGSSAAKEN